MATRGLITQDLKDWATAMRWVGNDGAHPGGEAVTKKDAENMLQLSEQFLHALYVAPTLARKHLDRKGAPTRTAVPSL